MILAQTLTIHLFMHIELARSFTWIAWCMTELGLVVFRSKALFTGCWMTLQTDGWLDWMTGAWKKDFLIVSSFCLKTLEIFINSLAVSDLFVKLRHLLAGTLRKKLRFAPTKHSLIHSLRECPYQKNMFFHPSCD